MKPSNSIKILLILGYNTVPLSAKLSSEHKNFLKTNDRKWEIFRITQENQFFMKRLVEKKSILDSQKWEKDFQRHIDKKIRSSTASKFNKSRPRTNEISHRLPTLTSDDIDIKEKTDLLLKPKKKTLTNADFYELIGKINI